MDKPVEKPKTNTNNDIFEKEVTRRHFLDGLGRIVTSVAASTLLTTEESSAKTDRSNQIQEIKESMNFVPEDNAPSIIIENAKRQKLEFKTCSQRPVEIDNLLVEVSEFINFNGQKQGILPDRNGVYSFDLTYNSWNAKSDFWQNIKNKHHKLFPNLPENLTKAGYFKFLALDLPSLLAKNGVFAMPMYFSKSINELNNENFKITTKDQDYFLVSDLAFSFVKIKNISRQKFSIWGSEISLDIIDIDNDLKVNNQSLNTRDWYSNVNAEIAYQSIFINKDILKEKECFRPTYTDENTFNNFFNKTDQAFFDEMLSSHSDREMAQVAYNRFVLKSKNFTSSYSEQLDTNYAHEAAHIIMELDKKYQKVLPIIQTNRFSIDETQADKLSYNELFAFIGQGRFSQDKKQIIKEMILCSQQTEIVCEKNHDSAVHTLFEESISRIAQNPKRYNFVLCQTNPELIKKEIWLKISDFIQKKTEFNLLMDDIFQANFIKLTGEAYEPIHMADQPNMYNIIGSVMGLAGIVGLGKLFLDWRGKRIAENKTLEAKKKENKRSNSKKKNRK